MKKMIIEKTIALSATKEKVWNALFDNEYAVQFMNSKIRKIEPNKLEWYKKINNYEQILLYADIIEFKPHETLKLKTFNPHRHYHSKYQLDVTYHISKKIKKQN